MTAEAGVLAGKACFVTAAAQGIGRAIADRFAQAGARVIAADLRFDVADRIGSNIERLVLDATDPLAVKVAASARPQQRVVTRIRRTCLMPNSRFGVRRGIAALVFSFKNKPYRRGIAALQCYPGLELRSWNSGRAAVGKLSANAQYGYYKA